MKRFHAESQTPIGFVTRCFLVLPPAFLIGLKYDIPHVPILAFLLILLPLFRKRTPSFGRGVLLFYFPVSVLLAMIPSYLFEVDPGRITPGDVLLRSHICVPLLLYASAFACGLRRSREITSFIVLMTLFATLICGDLSMARTLSNVRFPLSDGLLHTYRYTYVVCSALQFFGILLLLTAEARLDSVSSPSERGWTAGFRLCLFLLIPCLAAGEVSFYLTHEKEAKEIERYLLYKLRRRSGNRTSFASSEVRISRSLRDDGAMPSGEILLRVRASEPPGYLRGRVYDSYNGGVWRISSPAREQTELADLSIDKDLSVGYYPFRNDQLRREGKTVEIFFARSFRTDYFPVPPRTLGVEMVADAAFLTPDGVLSARNPSRSAGYIAWIPASSEYGGAFQEPADPDRRELRRFLQIPWKDSSSGTLAFMSRALLSSAGKRASPGEMMRRVTDFLKNNYLYSLDPGTDSRFAIRRIRKLPPPDDPVERFLIHTGAGHCELFASSAVLLLRAMGIPARYVTGFVCEGFHSPGICYVSDRDAHAWAEAYDFESRKWVLLDPTPSVWREGTGERSMNFWETFQTSSDSFLDNVFASVVRGYAGKSISEFFRSLWERLLLFAAEPSGAAFLLTLLLCTVFLTFFFRRMFDPYRWYPPEHLRALRAMMKLEKRLAFRTHLRRKPGQTWSEWADSFRTYAFGPALAKLTGQYEKIRYRPAGLPSGKEEAELFSHAAESFWKEIRRASKRVFQDGAKRPGPGHSRR